MAKANTEWTVLPHRPLLKLAENLYYVEGDLEQMPLKRVMTVARRSDGDLVIHNAIALNKGSMDELENLGKVRYLIVPNGWHRLDARVYKDRYPEARVFCPRGARARVSEVVSVDGAYEDFPADAAVSFATLEGVAQREGVMSVKSHDGVTLVFNDVLFNMPHVEGFHGFVLKYITGSSGGLRITRIAKLALIKDRAAFRAHAERLADTKALRRIIVSHHEVVKTDAAARLRAALSSL